MASKLSLVSETVLTKEMEFSFELFLAPRMARSLVRLPRLLRVSQVLLLLLFLLPTCCRACRFHENLLDRKSTRLNCSHRTISYAVFCLKKKVTRSETFGPLGTSQRDGRISACQ